jgi:hypothetical protein
MTKRKARSVLVLVTLGIGLTLGSFGTARAQPILKRLEQRIRSRVEPDQPAAPDGAAEPGQEPTPGAARVQQTSAAPAAPQPGYLGLVADDQGEENRGVRVLEVKPGGPAEKAGFKQQDLITSVAGIRVRSLTEMADVMELFPPGKTVAFEVLRGEAGQQLSATLGNRQGAVAAPPRVVTSERPPEATPPPRDDVPPDPAPPAGPLPGELPAAGGLALPPAEHPPVERPLPAAGRQPTVEELLQRIEALERRVTELERAVAQPHP